MKLRTFNIQTPSGLAFLTGILFLGMVASASAQTTPADSILNRTVVVEQEYNPDIMDAQKINIIPEVEEIKVIPRQVEYDSKMMPATSLPAETMDAYAGKEVQGDTKKGYARLGYGMFGNLDAKANYLFTLSPKDKLNLNFSMDGRDGKLPIAYDTKKWENHFYRTRLGINYLHNFRRVDLDIAGDFDISNFNSLIHGNVAQKKFTSGGGHVGLVSTDNDLPLQFKAETNLLLYSRNYNPLFESAFKETIVRTKADVVGSINDEHRVGVAFAMDNKFYGYKDFDNFTTLLLNPYFETGSDNWNLHLGVNVDLAFGYGDKFNVSTDIKARYIFSDSYILYAEATGGRVSNDYRRLGQIDPFAEITFQPEDSYKQIHALAGFKASPVNGLWLNLYGGYNKTKNDIFNEYISTGDMPVAYTAFYQVDSNNFFAGADVNYSYKNIFFFNLFGKYYKWDADEDQLALLMPEFKLGGELGLSPIKPLNINLSYEYIQRTKVENNDREMAVNNLGLGVSYNVFDGISVYAKATNLLNKKYSYYLCYPDQGASFVGGLSFRF